MGLIFESLYDDEPDRKRHSSVEDEYDDEQNSVNADDYEEDDEYDGYDGGYNDASDEGYEDDSDITDVSDADTEVNQENIGAVGAEPEAYEEDEASEKSERVAYTEALEDDGEVVDAEALEDNEEVVDTEALEDDGEVVDAEALEDNGEVVDAEALEDDGEAVDTEALEDDGEVVDAEALEDNEDAADPDEVDSYSGVKGQDVVNVNQNTSEDDADFSDDDAEDIADAENDGPELLVSSKGRKKPHPAAIVVPAILLALIVSAYFINKHYPLKGIFGGADANSQQVEQADNGQYADWTVMERIKIDGADYFSLELPSNVGLNDISIENHYRDRALLIRIKKASAEYFVNAALKGNISDIAVAAWKVKDGEVLLSLQMSGIWEYEVSQENGTLVVNKCKAGEKYAAVVVLDPVVSEGVSEDITALLSEAVVQKAAEEGIKVYVTRGNGGDRSEAERLALIVDSEPDYVLEITAASDSDSSKYGMSAVYNEKYFDPECDNVHVADILLRSIANAASNRADSIEDASEDSLLRLVRMPAAGINIGYISNTKECELLGNEGYRNRIADGIVSGIKELLEER